MTNLWRKERKIK